MCHQLNIIKPKSRNLSNDEERLNPAGCHYEQPTCRQEHFYNFLQAIHYERHIGRHEHLFCVKCIYSSSKKKISPTVDSFTYETNYCGIAVTSCYDEKTKKAQPNTIFSKRPKWRRQGVCQQNRKIGEMEKNWVGEMGGNRGNRKYEVKRK